MAHLTKKEVDALNAQLGTSITLDQANAIYDTFTPLIGDVRQMENLAFNSYANLVSFYDWLKKEMPGAPQIDTLKGVLTTFRQAWPSLHDPDVGGL